MSGEQIHDEIWPILGRYTERSVARTAVCLELAGRVGLSY
jgi:hypothetical protein